MTILLVKKVLIRYYSFVKTELIYDYIERLSNLSRNATRQEGAEYGLQPVQLEALHYLSLCNRYSDTPMGVTEYLGQTKGSVSQSLKVLEKKGFLTKQADKKDKRITHLKVSPAGKKLLRKAIPAPVFIHACEALDDESQERISSALGELLHAVQLANGMKSFGVCRTCRYNREEKNNKSFCGLTEEPLSKSDVQLICREHEE